MTGPAAPDRPPTAPDGTALTPEEWDAVRRLRGEPEQAEPAEPAAEPALAESPRWGGAGAVAVDRRTRAGLTATSLMLVLAVAAAALAAVVASHLSAKHSSSGDATDAIAAATDGVATVLSYNYRSLDNDFTKAESLLTPAFRKTYITTTAKAVQPLAAKYKAVSSAQVTAAGVVSQASDHVKVLVFVNQTVTNSQLAKPRLDRSRVNVDLVRHGDRWLINNLDPV